MSFINKPTFIIYSIQLKR